MTSLLVEERILIASPFRKDAELAALALGTTGLHSKQCQTMPSLLQALNEGVGALLTFEEALTVEWLEALQAFVTDQPSWSDVPILVLTRPGDSQRWTQWLASTILAGRRQLSWPVKRSVVNPSFPSFSAWR